MTKCSSELSDSDARRRICTALDDTVVVEAAAGTGKTTELVHRIVNVLAEGRTEVDRIVAVTFTEKAAGELKLRLRIELEKARLGFGGDRPRQQRLEEAVAHLEEAHVGTIHSFCADLLRERPVEAAVDPRFEVLLEPEADALYNEAFDLWLQQTLEDPPEGVRRSLRRSSFAPAWKLSAGSADDGPVSRLRRAGLTLVTWRDFEAPWRRDPFARETDIDALVERLHQLADATRRPARTDDNFYRDTRLARRASDDIRGAERLRPRDYDAVEALLVDLARNRDFARARRGSGSSYRDGVSRADLLEAHRELVASLLAFARAADADLASRLRDELWETIVRYEALKDRVGRLDFIDLLVRARNLVRDHDDVRADFQRRFTHIFVDEFQDTDPLQAEILLLLASGDPSVRDWQKVISAPGKLFLVGDPKQAIYRFRRADVGIYENVKRQLMAGGALLLRLDTSFRATPAIQRMVNAAFAPVMTGNRDLLQANYVPLEPSRQDHPARPSIVALPVPKPYGQRRIAAAAIEGSLPAAVGAFIDWLRTDSGWMVTERDRPTELVPLEARHICILFRRFDHFGDDVTRPYVETLESRGIPHLLVGGKSFHEREEVETMRTALSAIEWPDDELSVFATLRGSLFAIGDEPLYEYRRRFKRLDPFRVRAEDLPEPLASIAQALGLIASLHRGRNQVPVSETVARLLQATRAHAGFALRPSGEQALANVLQIAEIARRYDAAGGISFRGFVDRLREEAEFEEAAEAPILEESSDGVRIMTVHKAKGLEFPVVILADITANLAHQQASRYVDADRRLCAVRIGGWSPAELLDHEAEEIARDEAEGIRIAYVAATRARDLLVIPVVGDSEYDGKWISALNRAIYPAFERRRSPEPAAGCPPFGKDSVLERPEGDPPRPETVAPGLYRFEVASPNGPESYGVVWWDPRKLSLDVPVRFGIRQRHLIGKEVDRAVVERDLAAYREWAAARAAALERGAVPTLRVFTATERALAGIDVTGPVELVRVERDGARPIGPRFGTLVHNVLSGARLDAPAEEIRDVAALQGRILGATPEEMASAAAAVETAFRHTLLRRAHAASREGKCRREAPISACEADGSLIEGFVDLAFEEADGWVVVDFKTDRDLAKGVDVYLRQVRLYADMIARATNRPARAILVHI